MRVTGATVACSGERRTAQALLLALLLSATPTAASPPDLIPIDRTFSAFEPAAPQKAYYQALVDALLRGSSLRASEAIVVPSFEREWAIYVQDAQGRGQLGLGSDAPGHGSREQGDGAGARPRPRTAPRPLNAPPV